jgi:hypothetical protein
MKSLFCLDENRSKIIVTIVIIASLGGLYLF